MQQISLFLKVLLIGCKFNIAANHTLYEQVQIVLVQTSAIYPA